MRMVSHQILESNKQTKVTIIRKNHHHHHRIKTLGLTSKVKTQFTGSFNSSLGQAEAIGRLEDSSEIIQSEERGQTNGGSGHLVWECRHLRPKSRCPGLVPSSLS